MASKKYNINKIKKAETLKELVEIGHKIENKDKDIDRAIREKMNEFLPMEIK
jgi:exonuclease VII small subunit